MSEPIPPEDLPDPPTLEDPDPIPPPVDFPDGGEVVGWLDAEVSGDRVNVFDAPIVAGDPAGARIEIRSTGLHAFNGTGTETAHIDGAGGAINAGSFSTASTNGTRIYMHNTARDNWPAIVFQTPGLYRSAAIAAYDGVQSDQGVWPNGTVVVNSGKIASGSSYSAIAAGPGAATMRTTLPTGSGGAFVQTDSLGNAKLEGKLGNRVLATDAGNAELQSSGGAVVNADSLGGAKMEGALGNRVLAAIAGSAELQSSGGAHVVADSLGGVEVKSAGGALNLALQDGEARISGSTGAQVRARPTGIVDIQAAGSGFYVARFGSTGVQVRDTLTVGGVDVMAKIADLEARIAALEA